MRRLVALHGGSVEAASAGEGKGSAFTVKLPRIDAPAALTGAEVAPAGVVPVERRLKVLIVEDHEDVRSMLRDALVIAGHEVHESADGNGGIEAALALRPEVALIDIGLPGASGYEVAERIRADRRGNGMMLVALTGYGQPEDRRRSLAAGFDLHATKPIDMAQLLRTIARWPGTVASVH